MNRSIDRRQFLGTSAAAGALTGLGDLSFLGGLPSVHADEVKASRAPLVLNGDLAPTVRLLMETPRERLLEEVAHRIQHGLSYQEVLGALLLAGVTNIEPRPEVGFKFHGVLVVNSAHIASLSSPPEHRWLPIFWALDYYKACEERDVEERGDWRMSEIDEARVPPASKARESLTTALDRWDESAADVAVASLARSAGSNEIAEIFFRYGCRDFRSIGHKAIFVSNAFRTLDSIGWNHSEPVLRSLAYALLNHEGSNPAERDDVADRPFRANQERLVKIRPAWLEGNADSKATQQLVSTFRTGSDEDACNQVVEMLNAKVSPHSIWDALHLTSGELLMRQPGIVAVHAVTTTNALHYAFMTSADDTTRRLVLLQNAAFLPMFRNAMQKRGDLSKHTIDDLTGTEVSTTSRPDVAEIFHELRSQPMTAAQKTVTYLKAGGGVNDVVDAARMLVFLKGSDAHDYKFSSAILEDCRLISPEWVPTFLAANVFRLRSSEDKDNTLVARTRAAFG